MTDDEENELNGTGMSLFFGSLLILYVVIVMVLEW